MGKWSFGGVVAIGLLLGSVMSCGSDEESGGAGAAGGASGSAGAGGSGGSGGSGGAGGSSASGGSGGSSASGGTGGAGGSAGASGSAGAGVIATGQQAPTGIDVDAENVYWANQGAGTVVTCPKAGCPAGGPTVLATGQPVLRGVSVDATSLYFLTKPPPADGGSINVRVLKCPIAGCTGQPEVFYEGGAFEPNDVQARAGLVYFTHWPGVSSCPPSGCSGGAEEQLGSGAGPVAVDADSQYLYVGRLGAQMVQRCPLTGCVATTGSELITGIHPISVAVDATSLYVSDYNALMWGPDAGTEARILKCPLAGCGASGPSVLASGDISPYAIAIDEERLYYTNFTHGTVVSIPK